jgi:DNA-binding response OmpR family regulator
MADCPATVLVVEDDDAMRELLTEELSDAGYRVRAASGGAAGLEAARSSRSIW